MQQYSDHLAAVKAIAWSPHQHGLLASGGGTADRCLRFWNTLTGQALQSTDTGSQVCNLAWSKHANELVRKRAHTHTQMNTYHLGDTVSVHRYWTVVHVTSWQRIMNNKQTNLSKVSYNNWKK